MNGIFIVPIGNKGGETLASEMVGVNKKVGPAFRLTYRARQLIGFIQITHGS